MTPRILPALVLAVGAFAAPPALAHDSTYLGGCSYAAARTLPLSLNPNGGAFTGEIDFSVALFSDSHPTVVEADVSCELYVEGRLVATLGPVHVVGAGAAADVLTFTAQINEFVRICDVVAYTDGTPAERTCSDVVLLCGLDCMAWEIVGPYVMEAEHDTCARVGGDVYVSDVWLVDCAPYGPY